MPFNKITQYKPGFSPNTNKIMSFIIIYVHFEWSTKNRQVFILFQLNLPWALLRMVKKTCNLRVSNSIRSIHAPVGIHPYLLVY